MLIIVKRFSLKTNVVVKLSLWKVLQDSFQNKELILLWRCNFVSCSQRCRLLLPNWNLCMRSKFAKYSYLENMNAISMNNINNSEDQYQNTNKIWQFSLETDIQALILVHIVKLLEGHFMIIFCSFGVSCFFCFLKLGDCRYWKSWCFDTFMWMAIEDYPGYHSALFHLFNYLTQWKPCIAGLP